MNILQIKVIGPRGSGKTTIMNVIRKALLAHDIECEMECCEGIQSEDMRVKLSRNDLKVLQAQP